MNKPKFIEMNNSAQATNLVNRNFNKLLDAYTKLNKTIKFVDEHYADVMEVDVLNIYDIVAPYNVNEEILHIEARGHAELIIEAFSAFPIKTEETYNYMLKIMDKYSDLFTYKKLDIFNFLCDYCPELTKYEIEHGDERKIKYKINYAKDATPSDFSILHNKKLFNV